MAPSEALDAVALVVDLENQLEQRGVLLGMRELQLSHPLPPCSRPRAASARWSLPVAQQVLAEAVLGPLCVLFGRLARPHQVPQRFMLRIRYPNGGQRSGLIRARKPLCIAAIRLDAIARLGWRQRRRDHLACDAIAVSCQYSA